MTDKPDRLAELMEAHGVIARLMTGNLTAMAQVLADRYSITIGAQVVTDAGITGRVTDYRASVGPRDNQMVPILVVMGHDGTYPWAVEWNPVTCRVVEVQG